MAKSIYQNKQWQVDYQGNIICREVFYQISRDMLLTMDWVHHMSNKSWCDLKELRKAIDFSLQNTRA